MSSDIVQSTDNSLVLYKAIRKRSFADMNTNVSDDYHLISVPDMHEPLPGILFITSYPPRECGIATYSQDLVQAIREKFGSSFSLRICALEGKETEHVYQIGRAHV